MAKTPVLIGGREACELLGIGRSTLTYWMLTDRLAPVQTIAGGKKVAAYLFDRAEVERIAAERVAS